MSFLSSRENCGYRVMYGMIMQSQTFDKTKITTGYNPVPDVCKSTSSLQGYHYVHIYWVLFHSFCCPCSVIMYDPFLSRIILYYSVLFFIILFHPLLSCIFLYYPVFFLLSCIILYYHVSSFIITFHPLLSCIKLTLNVLSLSKHAEFSQ